MRQCAVCVPPTCVTGAGSCVPALWLRSDRFWEPALLLCRCPGSVFQQKPAPAPSAGRWWRWSGCVSAFASRSVRRDPWRACKELEKGIKCHRVSMCNMCVCVIWMLSNEKVKFDFFFFLVWNPFKHAPVILPIVLRMWLPVDYLWADNAADLWCG